VRSGAFGFALTVGHESSLMLERSSDER
jgi:hypothetical protein